MDKVLILIVLFISIHLHAQVEYNLTDDVYLDNIKTVRLHHVGLPTSAPIIDLNSGGRLLLSFDDMEGGDITYRYKIIHCDKNWNPSELDELDYIDGFNDEQIEDSYYSIGTFQDYTHYQLTIPNDDISWTLSGNYILYVYEDEYDEVPAFTRRFMVVEPLVKVIAEAVIPTNVQKIRTHQEIQFKVNSKNFRIINPMNEIELVIMQNNQWDSAITEIKPRFVNGDDIMFNYVGRHNFPAGKEFRTVDLRSTRYRGEGVRFLDIKPYGVDMLLNMDIDRSKQGYYTSPDLNGHFVTGSNDVFNNNQEEEYSSIEEQRAAEEEDNIENQIRSSYVNTCFFLEVEYPLLDAEIYVVGQLSDWKLKEEFKMQYDPVREFYTSFILLKQGFYDYKYAVDYGDELDFSALEGDSYETENDYTILTYYTEFGARYDRLIGLATLNSNL